MKIRLMGPSCSMRTDGQTETTKIIVAFHIFANASKKKRVDADYVKLATG